MGTFSDPGVPGNPRLLDAIQRRTPLNPGSASLVRLPGGTIITPLRKRQAAGGVAEPHPWQISTEMVDDVLNFKVRGEGATVDKRWTNAPLTVAGLDAATPLPGGEEGTSYIYLVGVFEEFYGMTSLAVEADEEKRDLLVTADGFQTELNIPIGCVIEGKITQLLRDPLVLAMTCFAGVPCYVPILSGGMMP